MSNPLAQPGDHAARIAALDVAQSFIVQAPAGSGKTGLLIQRYLALLATVNEPEEIAAITFTRKAAAEMLQRVLEALAMAREPEPAEPHRQATWRLARAAAARDAERQWHVTDNPSRLRMQTIDSLCASLTRQMPLISRFGAQPGTTDDAQPYYLEAAHNTLALLDSKDAAAEDVALLLTHLDNNLPQATALLAAMLKKRDQWLRHLGRAGDREHLESALANIRRQAMAAVLDAMPDGIENALEVGAWAAGNLSAIGADSPLQALATVDGLPGTDETDVPLWLGMAELLLTQKDTWRKVVNKNQGFPSEGSKSEKDLSKAMKARLIDWIGELSGTPQSEVFRLALANIRMLPPREYSQAQWEALGAIARLLPRATAELWNVFAANGECDFVEVSQAASRALGDLDAPTDLALALDYRIRHLLIDEFQDTSFTQFELLEKLTAGWQPDDGRTLFLVGDPMQSIYRFREAEVGLFLKARAAGVGGVPLRPLQLSVNFRSASGIVDWVNDTFSVCMPQVEDVGLGAVSHARADAFHPAGPGVAVQVHALFADEPDNEAARVVALVQAEQAAAPDSSIAILVRSRSVLQDIVPALKAAGLGFRAVDIDPLAARPVVRDLTALTRALVHGADRIAWLAILRAPWCGLTLADMHALSAGDIGSGRTVWESLCENGGTLSPDGSARIARLRAVLEPVLAEGRRDTLRSRVERAWLQLGGPATLESAGSLDDAALFLDHLSAHERAGTLENVSDFEVTLAELFAAPDPAADGRLTIMTLHKAKGLEFDTVIIPGLSKRAPAQDKQLMSWVERARLRQDGAAGDSELLLAPVAETGSRGEPINATIRSIAAQREAFERTRLMYVGTTRAKHALHLLATLKRKPGEAGLEVAAPNASSLLASLWPVMAASVEARSAATPWLEAAPLPGANERPPLKRLASGWLPPPADSPRVAIPPQTRAALPDAVSFDWASPTARHVGTITHRWLQRIAEQGLEAWQASRVVADRPAMERALRQLGVAEPALAEAADRVIGALNRALTDERGRWLLGAQSEAACELRLTGWVDGELMDAVIDRTFRDSAGTRWVIDYKTGGHEGGELDTFLDREQRRYAPQLQRYAALYRGLDAATPVRLALYFPALGGWREWAPAA